MNVTSLETSQRLYELRGWVDTQNYWKSLISHDAKTWRDFKVVDFNGAEIPEAFGERTYPAYDLGFLLRKLPNGSYAGKDLSGTGVAWCREHNLDQAADNPTEAAALLCIKLIEEGKL